MERSKMNVCFIFGGKSSEHEVSEVSAAGVLGNADTDKYNLIKVGVTKDGRFFRYYGDNDRIRKGSWISDSENIRPAFFADNSRLGVVGEDGKCEFLHIDVAFPVMHGAYGEDGRMQGLLEMYGIRHVGPGCCASAVCMDKEYTRLVLEHFGIPQAKTVYITSEEIFAAKSADEFAGRLACIGTPVFVKPANAGSSVGISKVHGENELMAALLKAAREDSKVLCEEFIDGKEVECAVLGNGDPVASVPGEIDPGADFYDYDTKYVSDTSQCYIPARIPAESAAYLRELAVKIYGILGCRGLSRVDFFVKKDGSVIFNEINTIPGFTPISMYPKLFMHGGMTYSQIIDRLIALAAE